MSKALVVWAVAIGVVLSVLGLWAITGEPGRQTVDPSLFTESMEPELPLPADAQPDRFGPGWWAP